MLSSQRGRCSVWMNHPWLPPDKQYGGKLCGRARWNGSLRGHKRMIEISAWPSNNSHVRQSIERPFKRHWRLDLKGVGVGKRVSVRVYLCGVRIIKKKKKKT